MKVTVKELRSLVRALGARSAEEERRKVAAIERLRPLLRQIDADKAEERRNSRGIATILAYVNARCSDEQAKPEEQEPAQSWTGSAVDLSDKDPDSKSH